MSRGLKKESLFTEGVRSIKNHVGRFFVMYELHYTLPFPATLRLAGGSLLTPSLSALSSTVIDFY